MHYKLWTITVKPNRVVGEQVDQGTNPIFNDNKLKLGMFGLNSGNQIMTVAPERYIADWKRSDGNCSPGTPV